jgi:hypothetical protein
MKSDILEKGILTLTPTHVTFNEWKGSSKDCTAPLASYTTTTTGTIFRVNGEF